MPKLYRLTKAAESDVEDIALYMYPNQGAVLAEQYLVGLDRFLNDIAVTPDLGTSVLDYPNHFWHQIYQKHLIVYTVHKKKVTVLRILHYQEGVNLS